jgi:hypothetical protein
MACEEQDAQVCELKVAAVAGVSMALSIGVGVGASSSAGPAAQHVQQQVQGSSLLFTAVTIEFLQLCFAANCKHI